MSIRCGRCQSRHDSVAEVRACYGTKSIGQPKAKPEVQDYPLATYQQVEFLRSLLADRTSTELTDRNWATGVLDALDAGTLGKRTASAAITRLQGWARTPREAVVQSGSLAGTVVRNVTGITQDGMYRNPETGEIFKAQFNKASGDGRRLYAKQLVLTHSSGETVTEISLTRSVEPNAYSASFIYRAGAIAQLRPEWRMTFEQARAFGALYGTCVRCGRTLTAEDSIDRMMGPVCAGKGWA